MKKIFLFVALLATISSYKSFSQDSTKQSQLTQVLAYYYNVKNALVTGNPATVSSNALSFVAAISNADTTIISEGNVQALANDANKIAAASDIKKQREYFASLSTNMVSLVKSVKLSDQPVYEAYCPMKKAVWLSSEKTIKNPYYGSAMLTCGTIKESF